MMNKTAESQHMIRFPDCDPFNHLNNSKYIDYFINAREDHEVSEYEFSNYEYASKTGMGWVVGQNQIVYLSPALLMEKVYIQSTIVEWNTTDILIEFRMWNEQKTKLKSLLWTRFVHCNIKTGKRTAHGVDLNEKFMPMENPLEKPMSFEERVLDVKGKSYGALS